MAGEIEKGRQAFGHQDLPSLGAQRRMEAELRRQPRVAQTGRQYNLAGGEIMRCRRYRESLPPTSADLRHERPFGPDARALQQRLAQGRQGRQGIRDAVMRAIGPPDHPRPEFRDQFEHCLAVEYARIVCARRRLVVHAPNRDFHRFQLRLAECDLDATGLTVADIDAAILGQQLCEIAPEVGGSAAESGIVGHVEPLASDPYQPEIAPRGMEAVVSTVEKQNLRAGLRQSIGERRTDKPTPDDGDIVHDRPRRRRKRLSMQSQLGRFGASVPQRGAIKGEGLDGETRPLTEGEVAQDLPRCRADAKAVA